MTRRNPAYKLLAAAFALACSLALVGADLGTMAQNSNSSTTADPAAQDAPRRGEGTPGTEHDMSGTFTGTVNAPDWNLSGPATITFTTNTFTIDAGGNTQSGTYTAREWPGQIAVSMRFGTELPANIVSVSAKHRGESLTLTSVRGESKKFSFTTAAAASRRRRGRRRATEMAPPPTPEPTPEPTPPPAN
ncbi:MAG: hypothetical protein LC800_08360 [Acidobacteria bacterium]|nr:hypothetical protein [Acidobacteriota bacterium]